jgi:DNA-binding NtrC family response regulator
MKSMSTSVTAQNHSPGSSAPLRAPTRGRCIFVVDDDPAMLSLLSDFLGGLGHEVRTFERATHALGALKTASVDGQTVDLVLSDIRMPEMTGNEFLTQCRALFPEVPVILATAFGSVEAALGAIRQGAYDYVVKPFQLGQLEISLTRALETRGLRAEVNALRQPSAQGWEFGRMMGKSASMREVFSLIEKVAPSSATVLVNGESGTGKEMVARAIHDMSPRSGAPFVAINCSAIPEGLLESELFGHAKGAFTGAAGAKKGLFAEAHGGTVFLDEIGDMPVSLQAKLLRVLQERSIRPVGESAVRDIDVRVVAATHRDLKAAIAAGRFREDLYYRLSVIPVMLPPLRQRREDIPLLAGHFLRKYASLNGSRVREFAPEALQALVGMRWEGNVRELENAVERAVVLASGPRVERSDLPSDDGGDAEDFFARTVMSLPTLEDLENRYMRYVLEKVGGRKDKASRILGINRRTLLRRKPLETAGGEGADDSCVEDGDSD